MAFQEYLTKREYECLKKIRDYGKEEDYTEEDYIKYITETEDE